MLLELLKQPGGPESAELDSSAATQRHWEIIRQKPFLRNIYSEWYGMLAESMPDGNEPVLEIGSGAGFFPEYVSNVITSDVVGLPDIDMVLDACSSWPVETNSLRGVALINVLHHLPDCRIFFAEATRCLKKGGRVCMIEPWVTDWSRFVYGNLHHEPFDPDTSDWTFETTGRLSGANGALPWIAIERDAAAFHQQFPELKLVHVKKIMPLRYLLSGGVSMRSLVPHWSFEFWKNVESCMQPIMSRTAMFALIVLEKQ